MKQTLKPKRKRNSARWLSLLLAITLCVVVFLPVAVNRTINRMLKNAMASGNGTVQLHYVGLTRSVFSVTFASDTQAKTPPVKVDSCVLTYRPLRLLRGKIDTMHVSGFSLHATTTDGTVKLPAIALFAHPRIKPETPGTFTLKRLQTLPITIGAISLDGYILLNTQTEHHAIPIHLKANSIGARKWEQIALSGDASLASARLAVTLVIDTTTDTLTATLTGHLSTDAWPYTLRQKLPAAISKASSSIDAHAEIQLDGASLKAFTFNADLEVDAATTAGNIVCSPHIEIQGDTRQITTDVTGIGAHLFDLPLALDATNVAWRHEHKALNGRLSLRMADNMPLSVDFHTDPTKSQIRISDSTNGWTGAVNVGDMTVTCTGARLTASGGARPPTALFPPFFATFSVENLALKNAQSKTLFQFPDGLGGHAEIETSGGHIIGNAAIHVPEAILPKYAVTLYDTTWNNTISLNSDGVPRLDASLQANTTFRDVEVASVDANLWQTTPQHYSLETTVNALGVTGHIESAISTTMPEGFVMSNTLAIAEQTLDLSHTAKLIPETAGITFSGRIAADAHYTIQPGQHAGAIQGQLTGGSVDWPDKKLSASDIQLTVNLPALPTLRSYAQFFGFKNFKFGRIAVDSGIAIFRIQDPSIWYLNNLVLNWCGGKIRGESTRISRNDEKNRITLHANHILLPALLEQLGIGVDAGEGGRMNGSLPILIENGRITVTDGFLHSTPGVISRMKLTPTARLKRTAATSIELSLAVDALSDFTYSWLRLSVDSDEEDLNIKFEMDGKPAKKLYYTLSDGTLIETRHANTFKGISLDSTFRLPLNEIISIATPFTDSHRSTERK